MADLSDISGKPLREMKLSPEVEAALRDIQAELADAYREGFLQMTENMSKMVSSINRIQETLNILVQHAHPQLKDKIPVAFQVAQYGEKPDLATAVVVADPIGTGFYLSQADIARALRLSQADVSVLIRAFGIDQDPQCSVVVRAGSKMKIVNYHQRAIDRFREYVASPPKTLKQGHRGHLDRVRRLLLTQPVP